MDQHDEHLRLISIFHYVVAALASLFALFPVIHLVIGIAMLTGGLAKGSDDEGLRWVGGFFVTFASVWIVMGLSFAICLVLAGRNIARRTRYTFCLVMAGLECVFVPFGTVLGVFSLILLTKDEVKARFDRGATPPVSG